MKLIYSSRRNNGMENLASSELEDDIQSKSETRDCLNECLRFSKGPNREVNFMAEDDAKVVDADHWAAWENPNAINDAIRE